MRADDFCHLAAELAFEHGDAALDYAQRAIVEFESTGASERAAFWYTLSVFLDDILTRRLDPESSIVLH